jgi:hypothetical protein
VGQFFYGHVAPVAVTVVLVGVCVHRWSRPFIRVRRARHRAATTASPLAPEEHDRIRDDPEVDEAGLDGADEQVKVDHGGVP